MTEEDIQRAESAQRVYDAVTKAMQALLAISPDDLDGASAVALGKAYVALNAVAASAPMSALLDDPGFQRMIED